MTSQKPILPIPPRWKPSSDPANIDVPGLDTEASTTDQIEQIEQLVTIKLQNIDENFSKIHNALANKLLPAVKRYSVGTEPVREAAKFWTSFYEQAAQIRIPTYDDYSTVNEIPSERDDTASSQEQTTEEEDERPVVQTQRPHEVYETTVNSETSFLPGQNAFSSTPATTARIASSHQSFASQGSDDPSWSQSPLVKLSQELKNFSIQPEAQQHGSTSSAGYDSIVDESSADSTFQQEETIHTIPHSAKGKGKDTSHPLLKKILRHNLYSASDNSSFDNSVKPTSPLKYRGKPKTPVVDKESNPYIPPSGPSANWSGVVDLRDVSLLTPQRHRTGKSSTAKSTTPGGEYEDSFDGLPPGMSPPVLMSPVRPPRSSAELGLLRLGQTPTREASERIQRDLLASALKSVRKSGVKAHRQQVVDSSMSTVPTPPSLSRYAKRGDYSTTSSSMTKDPSLESMIRNIRQDIMVGGSGTSGSAGHAGRGGGSTPALKFRPRAQQEMNMGLNQGELATPMYAPSSHPQYQQGDVSLDSASDSLDSINNSGNPSAAFLMASGGAQVYDDDSFGSNQSSDSLENEDVGALGDGIVPVHPFASNAAVVDNGFDDDDDESSDGFETGHPGALGGGMINEFEEETLFGVAPAQRQSAAAAAYDGRNLRMLGEDLLQDTIGIGAQIAANGRVEESPTPANWGR